MWLKENLPGLLGTPSAPEKLHYTDRGKTSISLAWQPPRWDGGSPIRGYYVEKMRSDSNEFDVANRKIFTECCGTIENLSENQEYQFRVKAVNEVGDGEPSKPITARIQDDESTTPLSVHHLCEVFWSWLEN